MIDTPSGPKIGKNCEYENLKSSGGRSIAISVTSLPISSPKIWLGSWKTGKEMKSPKLWPAKPLLNDLVVSECPVASPLVSRPLSALPKSKPEVSGSGMLSRSKSGSPTGPAMPRRRCGRR